MDFLTSIVVVVALLVSAAILSRSKRQRTSGLHSLPEAPGALPRWLGLLGGHTLTLDFSQPHIQREEWAKTMGDFRIKFATLEWAVLTSEEDCRRVGNLRPTKMARGAKNGLSTAMGSFLFFLEGKDWGRIRRLTAPAFSEQNVKAMSKTVVTVANRLADKWEAAGRAGQTVDAKDDLNRMTHDVIALVGFGHEAHSLVNTDTMSFVAVKSTMKMLHRRIFNPLISVCWTYMPLFPPRVKYLRLQHKLDQLIQSMIDRERDALAKQQDAGTAAGGSSKSADGHDDGNLLAKLVRAQVRDQAKSQDGKKEQILSNRELVDNIKGYFVAGTDTTAYALCWVLWYMATHPDKQKRARQEVQEAVDRDGQFPATHEAIMQLRYCAGVVQESMRLRFIAPTVSGYTLEPYTDSKGREFPKDTSLMCLSRPLAKREQSFSRPEDFLPERWLVEEQPRLAEEVGMQPEDFRHDPSVLMGFGLGPRKCPGQGLANLELVVTLAVLVHRLNIQLAPGHPPVRETPNFAIGINELSLLTTPRCNK